LATRLLQEHIREIGGSPAGASPGAWSFRSHRQRLGFADLNGRVTQPGERRLDRAEVASSIEPCSAHPREPKENETPPGGAAGRCRCDYARSSFPPGDSLYLVAGLAVSVQVVG